LEVLRRCALNPSFHSRHRISRTDFDICLKEYYDAIVLGSRFSKKADRAIADILQAIDEGTSEERDYHHMLDDKELVREFLESADSAAMQHVLEVALVRLSEGEPVFQVKHEVLRAMSRIKPRVKAKRQGYFANEQTLPSPRLG